jgi:hypothetical protein
MITQAQRRLVTIPALLAVADRVPAFWMGGCLDYVRAWCPQRCDGVRNEDGERRRRCFASPDDDMTYILYVQCNGIEARNVTTLLLHLHEHGGNITKSAQQPPLASDLLSTAVVKQPYR